MLAALCDVVVRRVDEPTRGDRIVVRQRWQRLFHRLQQGPGRCVLLQARRQRRPAVIELAGFRGAEAIERRSRLKRG